jgi:hypothetical protein
MVTSLFFADVMMLLVIFFVVSPPSSACLAANARIAASRAMPDPRHSAASRRGCSTGVPVVSTNVRAYTTCAPARAGRTPDGVGGPAR